MFGAIVKFSFLFASVTFSLKLNDLPSKLVGVLYLSFSWPQIVTALLGGILYLTAKKILRSKLSTDESLSNCKQQMFSVFYISPVSVFVFGIFKTINDV